MYDELFKTYDTVVIGTGASGYAAACHIAEQAKKSVCIVTEGITSGTSRSTGSDKQTYYKLSLGGDHTDSVRSMAETLFAGGSADGDNALCEAALSARCFYRLCEAGVPFPADRYGAYIGYKTDHDPFERATSAGPLTSKYMTEALEKRAKLLSVPVYDGLLAVEILKCESGVCGLLCLNIETGGFTAFRCASVILATGGPAGIYADSVYPHSQYGSTGLAIHAGARLQNLTEWQYGLASVSPRWNVSGTYMQVLPRFVSVDEGGNEHEFLAEYFGDPYAALSKVFLKGYEWPFDVKKVQNGSSVIDLLVYRETVLKKRRVFLDFTKNPFGLSEIAYESLSAEAFTYLKNADACFGTPIERLERMNTPAIELYASKGVDLTEEYLEIALCAQHHNGGIAVDLWWQTSIEGLFAVGECAGTHGVTRPGGSALNAGQVGALRAAQYISASDRTTVDEAKFAEIAKAASDRHRAFCDTALKTPANVDTVTVNVRKDMSAYGGAIRNRAEIDRLLSATDKALQAFGTRFGISSPKDAYKLYRLLDILTVRRAVLFAMSDYAKNVPSSRGSALYTDKDGTLRSGLEERFRFVFDTDKAAYDLVQEILCENGTLRAHWRPVRRIPDENGIFESVWRQYRENQNIF